MTTLFNYNPRQSQEPYAMFMIWGAAYTTLCLFLLIGCCIKKQRDLATLSHLKEPLLPINEEEKHQKFQEFLAFHELRS